MTLTLPEPVIAAASSAFFTLFIAANFIIAR